MYANIRCVQFVVCNSDDDCSGERICEEFNSTTVCCQPFQGISCI